VWTGHGLPSAIVFGMALGLGVILVPYMFDPIPVPLSREHIPMRAPVLRRLCRIRHWANPFYVETIVLRSPYRPAYCGAELAAAVLRFPWFPIAQPNIAGRVSGSGFVLKRMTFWADGGRPTAAGRFVAEAPGTVIKLRVAAPAVGVYFLLIFMAAMAALVIAATFAAITSPAARVPVAVIIGIAALMVLAIMAIVAAPLSPKVRFIRQTPEGDRYVAFFSDVLGAEVVSRE